MKKITTLFMMLLAAVMTLSMSSCTEDQEIGMTLEGAWEGYTHVYHEYNGQLYQSTRTKLTFNADLFKVKSGTGYWVDYYSSSPWGDYYADRFSWYVLDQIIYIHFKKDNLDIEIRDYRLYNDRFIGTIYIPGGDVVDFSLYKISDPNWNDYDYGYYYYSKETRAGSDEAVEKPKRMFIPDAEE